MADDAGHERALGHVQGSLDALNNTLRDMRAAAERAASDAATSRQRLHEKVDKAGTELALVAHRVRVVEQQVEGYNNQFKLYAPLTSVQALQDAQAELETAVNDFNVIKNKIAGAALMGKWMWAVTVTLAGAVGASITALYHYLTAKGT